MEDEIGDALCVRSDRINEVIVRELEDGELALVRSDDEVGSGEGDGGLVDSGGDEKIVREVGGRSKGFGRLE